MTENEIYEEMLAAFEAETGYEMNSEADLAVRLRAAAAQIMSLYQYADYTFRQAFPQTAEGDNLDLHGELRGLLRIPARRARGNLLFEIQHAADGDLLIPAGTVCVTADFVQVETIEDAVLTAGTSQVIVPALATEAGSAGNIAAFTVTKMLSPPVGIETVTNVSKFTGGREKESDEAYRKRILSSYGGIRNGANAAFYREIAMSAGDVDWVKIVPQMEGTGTVGVLVDMDEGMVPEETINAIQAAIDAEREICTTVHVKMPETVSATIKATIQAAEGYTFAEAQAIVEEAIRKSFLGDRIGKPVCLAEIIQKSMETGAIRNITITAPTEDKAVLSTQKAVLTSLTIGGS